MQDTLEKQRTFVLVGHSSTGKTTLAEMFLYNAGALGRMGAIDKGTTSLDYEPEETKRGGSIQPAFAHYVWKKNTHFLIDTPGDTNFVGDLAHHLLASDSAVFVIDAIDGVKPLTKKLWNEVKKAGLPSMVVINKMDRERANFDMAYAGLSDVLGMKPVVLYLPIGAEADFRGLVDVLEGKALFFKDDGKVEAGDIPDELADQAAELREFSLENIAESEDELMEKYLEEGDLSQEDILQGLAKGVLSGELVPVCTCAAQANKGGQQILEAIQNYLPSPLQRGPWEGEDGATRASSPDEPLAGYVFKTIADPFAGQLSIMRVVSGVLSSDVQLYNPTRDVKEKIGQLLYLVGKKQEPCKENVGPGAVVAVAKLKDTATGDTLCEEKTPFVVKRPEMPPQLISYALAAAEKGEEDKVFAAVQKLLDEDINLKLERNEETGDMLLSGMGQLHIELSVEKAKRRYKADILLKTPTVPYRETVKGKAEVQGRYKKQTGGRGQFGDCWIRLAPKARGEGYEFIDSIVGGVIPRQYIPAVDKGIQEASVKGVVAGYPMVDFQVELFDGSYHNVDSSEMAFKVAGSMAFKKACEKAGIALLEPIMQMHISVPEEFMGDIIGDLSSRRGKVLGYESDQGITEITAQVPMSEILRYAPDLRSMTGGQGTFTMEFHHYEECPPQVADKVIADSKAEE